MQRDNPGKFTKQALLAACEGLAGQETTVADALAYVAATAAEITVLERAYRLPSPPR